MSLILCGHQGAGKTTIAKAISEKHQYEFIDTDELILSASEADSVRFSNLKPSLKSISIRLPESMIEKFKVLANKRDIPYQSLIKIFLSESLDRELHKAP